METSYVQQRRSLSEGVIPEMNKINENDTSLSATDKKVTSTVQTTWENKQVGKERQLGRLLTPRVSNVGRGSSSLNDLYDGLNRPPVTSSHKGSAIFQKPETLNISLQESVEEEALGGSVKDSEKPEPSNAAERQEEKSEHEERRAEMIPTGFKTENFINPELCKLQLINIAEFENLSQQFVASTRKIYTGNHLLTPHDAKEIDRLHGKLVASAAAVAYFITEAAGGKLKTKQQQLDFFRLLKCSLQKTPLLTSKFETLLDDTSKGLSKLLMLDMDNLSHDSRVKELVFLDEKEMTFSRKLDKGKTPLELKRKEIKVLYAFRLTLLFLAQNLEKLGNDEKIDFSSFKPEQKKLLLKVDSLLLKLVHAFKENDRNEYKLREIFPEIENQYTTVISYKKKFYEVVSTAISTQLIDIFLIRANLQKHKEIIHTRSDELKLDHKRNDLFYKDCLKEFENSRASQKYDEEFLTWWKRMVADGMVCYKDEDENILLPPKKAQNDGEANEFIGSSTLLLSQYAFRDKMFLPNFFIALSSIREIYEPDKPKPKNDLQMHAFNFTFLEGLQKNPQRVLILKHFNEELFATNREAIERLAAKVKNNRLSCLPIELAIEFMLRFYRAINHKYIMLPLANLKDLANQTYPEFGRFIKDIGEEELKDTLFQGPKGIFIILKSSGYQIKTMRVDQIDPGEAVEDAYCRVYTYTSVQEPYPGEPRLEQPDAIEFSYSHVKKGTSTATEDLVNEKVRLLGLMIKAAEYPPFAERFPETKESHR